MIRLQASWLDSFLAEYRRKGVSPKTVLRYGQILEELARNYHIDLLSIEIEALLQHLDSFQQNHARATYRLHCFLIRKALQFLGRETVASKVKLPRLPDPANSAKKTLSVEDRRKLITEAPTLRDRLLIEILDETGPRIGEIKNLRIKDAAFDEYSGILTLNGKTGLRRRRIYAATRDLREYLNNHPKKTDPNHSLFTSSTGRPFEDWDYYRTVKRLGRKILHKEIHPHMFRHTRATEDSRHFTDREMMTLFGWKRPDMVSVYSHLSMRDVDEKDLMLHGFKPREEVLRPLVRVQKCVKCNEENAPVAIYCVKCGAVLLEGKPDVEAILKDRKFIESLTQNRDFLSALKKALSST